MVTGRQGVPYSEDTAIGGGKGTIEKTTGLGPPTWSMLGVGLGGLTGNTEMLGAELAAGRNTWKNCPVSGSNSIFL